MEVLIINRLITIETIEIAHGIRLIRSIKSQTMIGNQILTIIINTENTIALSCISSLSINRVDILRILRTISIKVDISECTSLKTKVCIKSHRRQSTKIPTCLDLTTHRVHIMNLLNILRLHRQSKECSQHKQKYTLHNSKCYILN